MIDQKCLAAGTGQTSLRVCVFAHVASEDWVSNPQDELWSVYATPSTTSATLAMRMCTNTCLMAYSGEQDVSVPYFSLDGSESAS
jgi:hypothetical protein